MTNNIAHPKVAKVEGRRVFTSDPIVHRGIFVGTNGENGEGEPMYRLACQGRNVRFYTYPIEDQNAPITCQKCGKH